MVLGMTSDQLDIISVDHPNSCEERCRVMLRKWTQCDPSATWGKLIDAVSMIPSVPGALGIDTEGMHIYCQMP